MNQFIEPLNNFLSGKMIKSLELSFIDLDHSSQKKWRSNEDDPLGKIINHMPTGFEFDWKSAGCLGKNKNFRAIIDSSDSG